jgi:hypothetical protein
MKDTYYTNKEIKENLPGPGNYENNLLSFG